MQEAKGERDDPWPLFRQTHSSRAAMNDLASDKNNAECNRRLYWFRRDMDES